MDLLFALFALLLAACALLAPILAGVALFKARKTEKRVERLEARLARADAQGDEARSHVEPGTPLPFREERARTAEPASARPSRTPRRSPQPLERAAVAAAPSGRPDRPEHPSPPRPRKARPPIAWEQWVGVRGAAVLGGLVLALAGLFFFKHAFERGWVTPRMRVMTGAATGLLALGAAELLRRRSYRFAPAATAAGGIVILYATTWASFRLYEFLSAAAALPLMAGITASCAWTSVRQRSQLVAVLGLIGGFATPLLLSMDSAHPLGLFGYLLLLDLGLLALGQRMRWPSLGLLGMLGTFLVELVWSTRHLDGGALPFALGSLAAFALVFAAAGQRGQEAERRRWLVSQVGALLLPFAFAAYFAALTDLGEALWPLALLLGVLTVGAHWIASRQSARWLVTGASAGTLAVTATWLASNAFGLGRMWEVSLCMVCLSGLAVLAQRAFASGDGPEAARRTWNFEPALVPLGFASLLLVCAVLGGGEVLAPWILGAVGLALVLHGLGSAPRLGALRVVGATLTGLTLAARSWDATPGVAAALPLLAAFAAFPLAAWTTRAEDEARAHWAWWAAGLAPAVFLALAGRLAPATEAGAWSAWGLTLCGLALVIVPAVTRRSGLAYLVGVLLYLGRRASWIRELLMNVEASALAGDLYMLELATLAAVLALPLVLRGGLGQRRLAALGTAAALLLSLPEHDELIAAHFDQQSTWHAATALGVLGLASGLLGRGVLGGATAAGTRYARQILAAAGLLLGLGVAQAVGLHIATTAVALAGLSWLLLWRWLPSLGLKLGGVALSGLAALLLLVLIGQAMRGQEVFESSTRLIWNDPGYATGVPALCALIAAWTLRAVEPARATNLEVRLLRGRRAWASALLGLLSAALVFAWLNLQVFSFFEEGAFLDLAPPDDPRRDLVLSITWILYALVLLTLGMARHVGGLRQVSLAFLLLSLFKVFLHDLGDLEGLYRVGSLLGLALSLIVVSLAYQRFVFPRSSSAREVVEGGGA